MESTKEELSLWCQVGKVVERLRSPADVGKYLDTNGPLKVFCKRGLWNGKTEFVLHQNGPTIYHEEDRAETNLLVDELKLYMRRQSDIGRDLRYIVIGDEDGQRNFFSIHSAVECITDNLRDFEKVQVWAGPILVMSLSPEGIKTDPSRDTATLLKMPIIKSIENVLTEAFGGYQVSISKPTRIAFTTVSMGVVKQTLSRSERLTFRHGRWSLEVSEIDGKALSRLLSGDRLLVGDDLIIDTVWKVVETDDIFEGGSVTYLLNTDHISICDRFLGHILTQQ